MFPKETLNKLIMLAARQAHRKRNQKITDLREFIEEPNRSFSKKLGFAKTKGLYQSVKT